MSILSKNLSNYGAFWVRIFLPICEAYPLGKAALPTLANCFCSQRDRIDYLLKESRSRSAT